MNFDELVGKFRQPPSPWSEGRTIPWDEPDFSRRMLREHLTQAHDGASRRLEKIDAHVDFIEQVALQGTPSRVLDLGCGPGLYALRLAERGHACHGIDFSPASIDYARSEADARGAECTFELADIREASFGTGFDLVMLLYGELNLFPRDEAVRLLERCRAALAPDGLLLLEVHSYEAVRQRGLAKPTWSAWQSGLFSEDPHLRLEESFWLDEGELSAGRYWILHPGDEKALCYGWTMQAYNDSGYAALLSDAGCRLVGTYPSISGQADTGDFPVLLAKPIE